MIAVVRIVLALLAFALLQTGTAAAQQAMTKLRFSESTSGFSFLQSNIPAVMGYFAEEGLEVEYVKSAAASTGVSALLSGDVDVYVGSTGALMKAQSRGADIVAIAALTSQFVSGIVISRAWADKHGLTPKSPVEDRMKALKGATIGVTGAGSGSDQIVRYCATLVGLNPETDVKIVSLGNQGAVYMAALEQGKVDGFALSAPTSYQAVKKYNAMILVDTPQGEVKSIDGYLYVVAAVRREWLARNEDVVVRMLRAFQKGMDTYHDPSRTNQMRDRVREVLYKNNVEADVLAEAWADNLGAVPKSVVITKEQMRLVIDFDNQFSRLKLSPEIVDKSFSDVYAKRAVSQLRTAAPKAN